MQLTSHKNSKNKTSVILQKESACIVAFTFAVLLLGSFLANTCVQILKHYGYAYIPGSFGKFIQFLLSFSTLPHLKWHAITCLCVNQLKLVSNIQTSL